MTLGALLISRWDWAWASAGVLLAALLLLLWSYRSAPPGIARWLCPFLKALGFAALLACLFEPLWSARRARPGANVFAILADNSEGLQIRDRGSSLTRAQQQASLLDPEKSSWQASLAENFDVQRYYFDSRLQSTLDFSELNYNGRSSALGAALGGIHERYRGRNLAGILLLTDGNATDIRSAPEISGDIPIYPVVIGTMDPLRDLAVKQIRSSRTDFEDAPVTIEAEVSAADYQGERVVGQLTDASGKVVSEQSVIVRKAADTVTFHFRIKPDAPGLAFYKFHVSSHGEWQNSSTSEETGEATLANNEALAAVNRAKGPYRILYVSGRPNWEFKFLNRAVQDDPQLQLTGLIRVARREPKFNFIGRAGETSNPLFRGFGNQSGEEIERYDQPVLVRLNTRDEKELAAGFPSNPEDLYGFHAVIVDDLESRFFTTEQMLLVQRFVSERGGGFLMLGGAESFIEGNYLRTPIGEMLPVYLDKMEAALTNADYAFDLTREGWLQPWARLRDNEMAEKARLDAMTPFKVLNAVREVKPGASVVGAVLDAKGRRRPALVVQRFGHGRTAALTIGDIWRWGFKDSDAQKDMNQAWRQMMRWLVTDVPNRVDINVEPGADPSAGTVQLRVRVRDRQFRPMDNSSVIVNIRPMMSSSTAASRTNQARLRAEPSDHEPGLYMAEYSSRHAGAFRAAAVATDETGAEIGRSEIGWSTELSSQEFHSLAPNRALLEDIARRTDGAVLSASGLAKFAKSLPQRQAPVMENWTYPVWHNPAWFLLALACFVSEWGIRRWKGLP